jgi:hypothetical protein
MSNILAELKEKAAQLPDGERAELALALIESLDGPADAGVEEAWRVEIEHRAGQVARGREEKSNSFRATRCSTGCAAGLGDSLLISS